MKGNKYLSELVDISNLRTKGLKDVEVIDYSAYIQEQKEKKSA